MVQKLHIILKIPHSCSFCSRKYA